jgi:hypothetical protein
MFFVAVAVGISSIWFGSIGCWVVYGYAFTSALLTCFPLLKKKIPLQYIHIAHRGGAAEDPKLVENTMPAFRNSKGVTDMLEIDVRLTKDGEVILMHDATLARLTGNHAPVSEVNYDDLPLLYPAGEHRGVAGEKGETRFSCGFFR